MKCVFNIVIILFDALILHIHWYDKHIISIENIWFFLPFSLQGVEIEKVVNSGPGLVFITYPEVVLKLPGGPIWAVAFFLMLVVCYIKSLYAIINNIVRIKPWNVYHFYFYFIT